jgi:hypothetical protein
VDDDDLERRAGKEPDDAHPETHDRSRDGDPSDYADPRVAQPGEDPPGEAARTEVNPDED